MSPPSMQQDEYGGPTAAISNNSSTMHQVLPILCMDFKCSHTTASCIARNARMRKSPTGNQASKLKLSHSSSARKLQQTMTSATTIQSGGDFFKSHDGHDFTRMMKSSAYQY